MSEKIRKTARIVLISAVLILIFCAGFIGWLTITEYDPKPIEAVEILGNAEEKPVLNGKISVLTFNIGYANLNKDADSFLDGGSEVRSGNKEIVEANMTGIEKIISEADADIVLLQEVDENSKRSFGINQKEILSEKTGGDYAIGYNYVCGYVPFPIPTIGKVKSGVVTVSDFEIEQAERMALPCPFSWPVSVANLKRCVLVSRCKIEGSDKELVVLNLHLEAYDDGKGKIAQTKMLWSILEEEYAKGNYVIAGGDFNQTFPGSLEKFPIKNPELWAPGVLENSALPEGWQYVYDDSVPTCRLLNQAYDPESEATQFYVIDGFIISPNVEIVSTKTIDCGFEFSDHNPVYMEIELK